MRLSITAPSKLLTALLLPTLLLTAACSKPTAPAPAPAPVTAPKAIDQPGAAPAPTTAAAWNDRAFTAIKAGQWQEAIQAAKEALALEKENAAAHFNLGRAYLGAGQAAEALKAFEQAHWRTEGANADVEYYRGQAAEAAGQPMTAYSIYRDALAKLPGPDKEIRAALEGVAATLAKNAPTKAQIEQILTEYRKSGGLPALPATAEKIKHFLLGPEGNALKVNDLVFRGDTTRARLVNFNPGDVGQLNQGWAWIQWWEQGRPHIQPTDEMSAHTVVSAYFLDGTDGQYLVLRQSLAMPDWYQLLTIWKYDPARPAWVQTAAPLAALPEKVGTAQFHKKTGLSIANPTRRVEFIALTAEGKTIRLCDADKKCITATWQGNQYVVK